LVCSLVFRLLTCKAKRICAACLIVLQPSPHTLFNLSLSFYCIFFSNQNIDDNIYLTTLQSPCHGCTQFIFKQMMEFFLIFTPTSEDQQSSGHRNTSLDLLMKDNSSKCTWKWIKILLSLPLTVNIFVKNFFVLFCYRGHVDDFIKMNSKNLFRSSEQIIEQLSVWGLNYHSGVASNDFLCRIIWWEQENALLSATIPRPVLTLSFTFFVWQNSFWSTAKTIVPRKELNQKSMVLILAFHFKYLSNSFSLYFIYFI